MVTTDMTKKLKINTLELRVNTFRAYIKSRTITNQANDIIARTAEDCVHRCEFYSGQISEALNNIPSEVIIHIEFVKEYEKYAQECLKSCEEMLNRIKEMATSKRKNCFIW